MLLPPRIIQPRLSVGGTSERPPVKSWRRTRLLHATQGPSDEVIGPGTAPPKALGVPNLVASPPKQCMGRAGAKLGWEESRVWSERREDRRAEQCEVEAIHMWAERWWPATGNLNARAVRGSPEQNAPPNPKQLKQFESIHDNAMSDDVWRGVLASFLWPVFSSRKNDTPLHAPAGRRHNAVCLQAPPGEALTKGRARCDPPTRTHNAPVPPSCLWA